MAQQMNSLLQGLSDSLNQYMGFSIKSRVENQQTIQKNALELEKGKQLEQHKSELDLKNKSALEVFKMTLDGDLDPDIASKLHPKAAKAVEAFYNKNGRMPKFGKEADTLLKPFDANNQKELNRENRINTAILNYTEKLEKNPIYVKLREQGISFDQLTELSELAKSGNTVSSAAMGIKAAKAMGEVGVMTEQDIKRYVQSGQLLQSAGDKLSKWLTGAPTDATVEEIQQIGSVLQNQFNSKVQPIYDTYINRLSENMGVSKEEAARRLDVPYAGGKQQQPSTVKQTSIKNPVSSGPAVGTVANGFRFKGGNWQDKNAWEKL